ncbi:hypothetical protein LZ31DRAFT_337289 [Colletotrichum somersetense]|nr:hypothetical protein LZ31DRAFT_337289 [Colletotrichum somersetense]
MACEARESNSSLDATLQQLCYHRYPVDWKRLERLLTRKREGGGVLGFLPSLLGLVAGECRPSLQRVGSAGATCPQFRGWQPKRLAMQSVSAMAGLTVR